MKLFLSPLILASGLVVIARDAGPHAPRPLSAPFTVCAGGDVTLGTNLDPRWARYAADTLQSIYGLRPHPDSLATQLSHFLTGAQIVLLNVEGAIGTGPAPQKCGPRSKNCFAFRQPTSAARALRRLVDSSVAVVGNIANNHSRDAGDAGRDSTVAHLEAAGVLVTGNDTIATPVPLPSGDTIGVLGFHTDSTTPDARDLAAVRRHVARAVAQYGTVIVTMHLGAEGPTAQRTRNAVERFLKSNRGNPVGFANAAFAGGATLVVGHGPHVLRAAEWRDDRLVLYSLGNLLTYGPFKLRDPTDRGAVACVTIDSARHVAAAELRPTMQKWPGVLQLDSSRRAWKLVDSLSALDFPRSGVAVDSLGRLIKRPSRAARLRQRQ
ncbi:MAG TPA: CapA family protein [Gemmatimonadaceae bacterium]